jgi:hypothetical protein
MNPKEFLLHECENVLATLQDVLRHDYAAGSSKEFYNEFCERLNYLKSLIDPVELTDISALALFANEVSVLSTLVHRIERSHAGEFPWPFTEYLKSLANPLCKEHLVVQDEDEPIIRVYAEGGLFSYQINLENDLSVLNVGRRIFTIVFPRTLRHHVLLHAIFGHEIGHAAWAVPQHKSALKGQVVEPLREAGPLNSTSQAKNWLKQSDAPAAIVELLEAYPDEYSDISPNQLDSWFQEFMCDLFGLVTFGPSFLAAHQTLLLALDPSGCLWGPYHPPYVCRRVMLWRACQHLGWPTFPAGIQDRELRASCEGFVKKYSGEAPGKWEDIFSQEQIAKAVDALRDILTKAGTSCYLMPDDPTLLPLVKMLHGQIPPCGSDLRGSEAPANRSVDFRHILFAGWLVADELSAQATVTGEQSYFLELNKLCEMGLLQQRAIDRYNDHKAGDKH